MTTIGTGEDLQVDLMALGARITALRVPLADGSRRNVVLGLADRDAYLACEDFLGATVGRVANRIRGGSFVLDGVEHRLDTNQGRHTLHGGSGGFDRREWTLVDQGPRHAVFELVSDDGDQGFPGRLTVRAAYEVSGPTLWTTYTATTDAPTVVNLSSHAYFNLEGPDGSVEGHQLEVRASRYLPVDDDIIPLGWAEPVGGTPFDLTVPMPLPSGPDGFDHCWVLDGWPEEGLRRVAVLEGGGLRLELDTDQPGLQVYTGGGRQNGIALEPQHFPDSPHHPDWPTVVLRPGEKYHWSSVLRLTEPVDEQA